MRLKAWGNAELWQSTADRKTVIHGTGAGIVRAGPEGIMKSVILTKLYLANFVLSAWQKNDQEIAENIERHHVSASLSLTIMLSHFVNLEEVI